MKSKNLWILLATVIALVSYAVWDYKKDAKNEEVKEQSKTLTAGDESKVTELRIKSNSIDIKIKKESDLWQITEPIQALADSAIVQEYLKGIFTEKSIQTLEKDQDLKNFGLDKPLGTIELTHDGKLKQYQVGSIKAYNGDVYLLVDNQQPIYLASSTWALKLEKKLFDFREKRMFLKSSSLIDRITVESLGKKFEIVKKQADGKDIWQFSDNRYKIDQNNIRNVVGIFNSPEIKEFVAEGKSYQSDKAKLKLGPELSKVTVFYPEGKVLYKLYKSKNDDFFIDVPEQNQVYKIGQNFDTHYTLTQDKPHPYRDNAEPFSFAKDQVKEVRLYLDKVDYVFKKENNDWVWKNSQPNLNFNSKKIEDWINLLSAFAATRFIDTKSFVLTPKKPIKLEFFNEKSELLVSYVFSDKTKQKINNEEIDVVPVKASLVSDVFYIRGSQLDDLKFNEAIQGKTQ